MKNWIIYRRKKNNNLIKTLNINFSDELIKKNIHIEN